MLFQTAGHIARSQNSNAQNLAMLCFGSIRGIEAGAGSVAQVVEENNSFSTQVASAAHRLQRLAQELSSSVRSSHVQALALRSGTKAIVAYTEKTASSGSEV